MTAYKASKDNLVKIVTALLTVFGLYLVYDDKYIISALIFMVLLISFLFAPRKYILHGSELIIERPMGNKCIPFESIKAIEIPDRSITRRTIRTFGVGGVFGYFGRFHNSKLGPLTLYATQRKNHVLLSLKSGSKIIITPDDLQLADAVRERIISTE